MVNGSRYLLPITRLLVYLFTRQLVYFSTNPTNRRQYSDLSSVALCGISLLMRQARVW